MLAPVLKNMHSGLRTPEKVESRVALADEVLRLANAAGDDSLAFEGHLFHCFAKLELEDFPSASSALAACSRLAKRLKQPYLAWVTASAKVCFAFTQARLDEIETLVQKAFDVGEELQSPKVALFRDAQLAHLLWLRGRLDELTSLWQRLSREYPRLLPTLECAMAAVSGERGNEEEARARFELLAADGFARLPRDGTWPQNMTFLAEACTLLRDEPRAARLYDLLRPLDGRFLVVVPILPWGAASHSLGRLAATMGRIDLARRHFEDAMAVNASIGARHWLARTQMAYAEMLLDCGANSDRARAVTLLAQSAEISGGLGMDAFARRAQAMLERAPRTRDATRAPHPVVDVGGDGSAGRTAEAGSPCVFRCEHGRYWTVAFGGVSFVLPDRKGLHVLAFLLGNPEQDLHVLELVRLVECPGLDLAKVAPEAAGESYTVQRGGGLGALLDDRAKREYRREIASLREQIEEAESFNDSERASALRARLKVFVEELASAVGLGGRDRPQADPCERARQKVQKNIRAAIEMIRGESPSLGNHLDAHLKTGGLCSYRPDPERPIRWTT